jgi:hypothetical protein
MSQAVLPQHQVMDYETLSNCFAAVFEDYKEDRRAIFVVHELRNDFPALVKFLEHNVQNGSWHISFNGLAFDSQITQYILENYRAWDPRDADGIARLLYAYAQKVIHSMSAPGVFSDYPEWKLHTKQVDLFKLNHWDNPAKSSSLKWIQFTTDWPNVEEMPIHHSTEITSIEEIEQIIEYCINDVRSTKHILHKSKKLVNLRAALTKEYGINLYSASEPRISKELFCHFLSDRMGMEKRAIKQLRTMREKIVLKDIIIPYIKFTTPTFQKILNNFREEVIIVNGGRLTLSSVSEKVKKASVTNEPHLSIFYKGVKTDYGLGGIHGVREAGVYEAKNGMIIMTSDVASFYPNLAIRNKWAPGHFNPDVFCPLYEWFYDERKKIPKKDPRNYVYKIILNSTYGLSNDINSFLYDPEFTLRITINGQLLLSMLYERLAENIPGAIPLMQNTDGLEMMIPAEYKDTYLQICKEWEQMTQLVLEHDEYQKMMIADVNNYIAVHKEKEIEEATPIAAAAKFAEIQADNPHYPTRVMGDRFFYTATKCKGRFEFHDLALHKNKSFLIIPKAIYDYFVKGIKPEITLQNNRNIYDYCGGVKIKGNWHFEERAIYDGSYCVRELQKLVRYYISTDGTKLVKVNNADGRQIQVESGKWLQRTFNQFEQKPWVEYKVDDGYYLNSIYKEINNIDVQTSRSGTQLQMF